MVSLVFSDNPLHSVYSGSIKSVTDLAVGRQVNDNVTVAVKRFFLFFLLFQGVTEAL